MARGRGNLTPQDVEYMNIISNNINNLLKMHGYKQIDLSKSTGIPPSTLTGYVKGTSIPIPGNVQKIADFFRVAKSDIDPRFGGATNSLTISSIVEVTTSLNEDRQLNVLSFAKSQLDEQNKIIQADFIKEHPRLYAVQAQEAHAAGVGYAYEGTASLDTYYTDRDNLKAYDYASLVSGDSMEPQIKDGDVILIKQGYDSVDGGIYSIDYDGKSYLKKVYLQGGQFIMKSINKKYDDIIIDLPLEDTYLNIIGKVVDWFTPVEKD